MKRSFRRSLTLLAVLTIFAYTHITNIRSERHLSDETSNDSSDETSDFNTEESDRPIMHTFFEPDPKGYCCGMLNSGHELLLTAWEQAWQERGWKTKVLTAEDAKLHPEFSTFESKLKETHLSLYDQKCYWRWFAMAATDSGGWMSDYDAFPLEMDANVGSQLAAESNGVFTSFSMHVPCLIYAAREEWDRILHLMLDTIKEDGNRRSSDMQSLIKVGERLGVEESGMIWKDQTYRTFAYSRNEDDQLVVDCETISGLKIAHLSHRGTLDAYRDKLYPEIDRKLGPINGRGVAAEIFMKDYREQCMN